MLLLTIEKAEPLSRHEKLQHTANPVMYEHCIDNLLQGLEVNPAGSS